MAKKKVPRIGAGVPESAESLTLWHAEIWYICTDCMKVSYEKFEPDDFCWSIVGTISRRCKCGGITSIIHHRVAQVYV